MTTVIVKVLNDWRIVILSRGFVNFIALLGGTLANMSLEWPFTMLSGVPL